MAPKSILPRKKIADFIDNLYDGDLHAKRVLSLANATLGVLVSASLAVHAIGQGLAQALGKLSKHGVKQVDRLLSNQGIDVWEFFGYWVPYLVGARLEVVVAMDWTSFARDQQDTVVLSMLTGHGRATPLMWRTVRSSTLKGQMKRYEKELLERLREVVPSQVKVTVVADRGFGDCKLFKTITQELGFAYVIRIRGDIYVTSAKGERRKAAQWVGQGGRSRTLRGAQVTDEHHLEVGRVVCVHDRKVTTRASYRRRVRRERFEWPPEDLSIPSFDYQMTPKISLNTRCSISISENLSINGQTRSSDQLGIWSYNINP